MPKTLFKSLLKISVFLLSISLLVNHANAAALKGEAYGKTFGSLQFNVDPGVNVGDFGSNDCNEAQKTCRIWGFSWSDTIGWIAWDGKSIQTALEDNGGIFPIEQQAKLTYNGNFDGFIWGNKTGWLGLSACNSIETANNCNNKAYCQWSNNGYCEAETTTNPPATDLQNADDWGVYVDLCELKNDANSCESNYCNWEGGQCIFDSENNPDGVPVRGYAWSEHLGWLKFGIEAGDQGFAGTFLDWTSDETAPEPQFNGNKIWIPNASPQGAILWRGFASEMDSEFDMISSDVDYTLDPNPGYAGCNTQINDSAMFVKNEDENEVSLNFPLIGQIDETVKNGHCRYEVSGVIYNTSQIGYFFGSDAKVRASNAGINPDNPSPHVIDASDLTLFTLAGDFDPTTSEITFEESAIADGYESLQSHFIPKDIAKNPILNIPFDLNGETVNNDLNNAIRNVYLEYQLDATNYFFDSVNITNNFKNNYPAPLNIESEIYPHSDLITYPKESGPSNKYNYNKGYLLNINGLAPTVNIDNQLILKGITLQTNTQEGVQALPAPTLSMSDYDLISDLNIDQNTALSGLPHAYNFVPALEVINGELNKDLINIGEELEATFELKNNSETLNLNQYSLDHILGFKDLNKNANEEALEIIELNLTPANDGSTSRTDRKEGATRYQLILSELDPLILRSNLFHNAIENIHEPFYSFSDDNDGTDFDGEYEADGQFYAEANDEEPYPPEIIDRSDKLPLSLKLPPGQEGKYSLALKANQYIGQVPDSKLTFNIDQYIAYQPNSASNLFAIYPAKPFINDVDVKTVGLGSPGLVGGEQIFEPVTGRDLEKVTITTSADLRKEIRRNVAQLTRTINLENCPSDLSLSEMPTDPSECVIVNESDDTILAIYNGGTLTLEGNGTNFLLPPTYKYTLILAGGANLNLKSNLVYSDEESSLGIMTLQNENGEGGNVYIDPAPTNLVGLLYAEGSLLSSPDGGNTLYYGNGKDPIALKNQLYWQGSIVSRNSIGGSANNIRPAHVDCSQWNDDLSACSKAYDLDLLRRFSPIYNNDQKGYYTKSETLFSGGGNCIENDPPQCSQGPLPTTITLDNQTTLFDSGNSKSLDTLYIERDNRATPLGFTNAGSFISSQEIR